MHWRVLDLRRLVHWLAVVGHLRGLLCHRARGRCLCGLRCWAGSLGLRGPTRDGGYRWPCRWTVLEGSRTARSGHRRGRARRWTRSVGSRASGPGRLARPCLAGLLAHWRPGRDRWHGRLWARAWRVTTCARRRRRSCISSRRVRCGARGPCCSGWLGERGWRLGSLWRSWPGALGEGRLAGRLGGRSCCCARRGSWAGRSWRCMLLFLGFDRLQHLVEEGELLGCALAPVEPYRIEVAAGATFHSRRESAKHERPVAQCESQAHDLSGHGWLSRFETDTGARDVAHRAHRLIAGIPSGGLERRDGCDFDSFSTATPAPVAHGQQHRQIPGAC